MDLITRVTDENAKVLLEEVKQGLEETNTFAKNSQHLLKNMDPPQTTAQNSTLLVETFETLTVLAGHHSMSHEDTKLILTLHTEATKAYLQNIQHSEFRIQNFPVLKYQPPDARSWGGGGVYYSRICNKLVFDICFMNIFYTYTHITYKHTIYTL